MGGGSLLSGQEATIMPHDSHRKAQLGKAGRVKYHKENEESWIMDNMKMKRVEGTLLLESHMLISSGGINRTVTQKG